MNVCIYKGRISSDLKLRETNNGTKVLNFSVAVKKKGSTTNGNRDCDFLPCVAYSNTAEMIDKYSGKGLRILVRGKNTMNTYQDKETGKTVYQTVTLVEEVDIIDFKENSDGENAVNEPMEETFPNISPEDLLF